MCLAIPALITSVEGTRAEADIGGIGRRISILLTPEVTPGDYVLLHAGYALSILDQEEARETLKLFAEMAALDGDPR